MSLERKLSEIEANAAVQGAAAVEARLHGITGFVLERPLLFAIGAFALLFAMMFLVARWWYG